MQRHSVIEISRISFSMKIFFKTAAVEVRTLQAHGEAQRLGGKAGLTSHGTGG